MTTRINVITFTKFSIIIEQRPTYMFFTDYDGKVYDLSTTKGWDEAMRTMGFVLDCKVHGRQYGLKDEPCSKGYTVACNEATWGLPCMACGYVGRNIEPQQDEMHNELCCGQMASNCDEPMCWTHSTWTDEPFN